ncbi:hypothetical protein TYRP_020864 [Tyrophagus putrescentiae]|nr:hypothetical protein TYRP_020864 [Tyrophagus putrescentiae]
MAPNNTSKSKLVAPKSVHSLSTRKQSATLKFSSMHSHGNGKLEQNLQNHHQQPPNRKSNDHFAVQMGVSKDHRTITTKQGRTPWYKSSIIKLIASPETGTTPIVNAVKTFTPTLQMLTAGELKGLQGEHAVPIKVFIDPQLVSPAQKLPAQPDVQSSNVDIKTSPLEESTANDKAIEVARTHPNDPSEQFVIEMDIKF